MRIKVAVVARTVGLEYDDRIRKECISLSKKADLKIFVNFTDNRKEKGVTSYGIPYESFQLKTRDALPSAKFLFLKSLEYYLQVRKELRNYDIVWVHEEYTWLFALLGPKGRVIWDQHEIPSRFQKRGLRLLFRTIEKRCKYIIHANEYRKNYLIKGGLINDVEKHKVIRNYPDNVFITVTENKIKHSELKKFLKWLSGGEYVYLQGLSTKRRYPFNTVESVLSSTNYKVVIAGNIDKNAKNNLLKKYGVDLKNRVYFLGMVDQLEIPFFLRRAKFTVVLYELSNPNYRYCEPNRMYQAIMLGVPIIVGCNEPMADLVNKYKFGVVLSDAGENLQTLKNNVNLLLENIEEYKANMAFNMDKINWQAQETEILRIIS